MNGYGIHMLVCDGGSGGRTLLTYVRIFVPMCGGWVEGYRGGESFLKAPMCPLWS